MLSIRTRFMFGGPVEENAFPGGDFDYEVSPGMHEQNL